MSKEENQEIIDTINQIPDITLEEIIEKLSLSITIPRLHYKLKKLGFSYKKRRYIQMHRSDQMYKKNAETGKQFN